MNKFDFSTINKQYLVNNADGFFRDTEAALNHLEEQIDTLENTNEIEVYRVIFVKDIESINVAELGNHWTPYLNDIDDQFIDYLKNECNGETIPGDTYIISAKYSIDSIDIPTTLMQNMLNPDENEIFIDNKSDYIGSLEYKKYDEDEFKELVKEETAITFLKTKYLAVLQWDDTYDIGYGLDQDILNFIKENPFPHRTMGCQDESERWAQLLANKFPSTLIEIHSGMYDDYGHSWIEIDGIIFDPTAAQFDDYPNIDNSNYDIHETEEVDTQKPVIMTDCDGVLLQWLAHTPSFVEDLGFNGDHLKESMSGNQFVPFFEVFCATNETEAKERLLQYNESHYMRSLPVIEEESIAVLNRLSKTHDIIVVTSFSDKEIAHKNRSANLKTHYNTNISELICLNPEEDKTETLKKYAESRNVVLWVDDQIKHVKHGINAGIDSFQFTHGMDCGRNTGEVKEINSWVDIEKHINRKTLKEKNKPKISKP
jgi:hypothetical protein